MKNMFPILLSLAALTTGGIFAACASIDPVAPEIGDVPPEEETDAGGDEAGSDADVADAGTDADADADADAAVDAAEACVPETDAVLVARECTAKELNCGDVTTADGCGASRVVSCGTCDTASGASCGAVNICTTTAGKYACGRFGVRNCLEACPAAPNDCEDTKRCVAACGGTTCPGKPSMCPTFSNAIGSARTCVQLADGGSCTPVTKTCTTGSECGFSSAHARAVCIRPDGGPGACSYCGAAGSSGLACGALVDGGATVCTEATSTCQ